MSTHLTREGLIAVFHTYGAPRERWRVGLELERHLLQPNGEPVPYFGDHGVGWLLEKLQPNGWTPYFEDGHLIALFRGGASVTLEPGSQFEFATSPYATIAEVDAESRAFNREVTVAIGDVPISPVALGYTPIAALDDIAWVPKGRYVIMRNYLSETGSLAHHMMKGTCATQGSYDFSNEADCARKVSLGILLGPLTTAIFANSPLTGGEPNGWMSYRGHIWTQTDARRTGFPEAATAFSFERWVDYLLDVPMMFRKQAGEWKPTSGVSFRQWMEHGIEGTKPDMDDWELHLTSVFPEVRVKHFIEVRGADCVNHDLAMSFAALFKGLFYDSQSLDEALNVAEEFASMGTSAERFHIACRDGLSGSLGERRMASWAERIVDIAGNGLDRLGSHERRFLTPVVDHISRGESPAVDSLRRWFGARERQQQFAALRYSDE